ncbi:hypothetical protein F3Y22_tig00110013pilonHSYRG00167 [Hibiscus syriacus]|uniref:Uncharacterized protein n=1 Tax=Hibiscus syriacus TaxID=106335 RepID=A0A6A3BQT7_HIBSY|nr:hypothetical protein F3Y22_tig00110013pilonHSYRG00167 [Hibiscus syriacus]
MPKDRSKNPPGFGFRSAKEAELWDDARWPICIENPHNAVLLRCSSSENSCRPFMCNTSNRYSNCFEQYFKLSSTSSLSAAMLPKIPSAEMNSTSSRGRSCRSPMLLCPLCRGEERFMVGRSWNQHDESLITKSGVVLLRHVISWGVTGNPGTMLDPISLMSGRRKWNRNVGVIGLGLRPKGIMKMLLSN